MKKIILTTLIALMAIFTSCKKQEMNNEWYAVKYQTLDDTLTVTIEGSKGVNNANSYPSFHSLNQLEVVSTTIQENLVKYVVSMQANDKVTLEFKKLDGSVASLEMQKNGALLNTRIK